MKLQFARLYLLILLMASLIIFAFNALYSNIIADKNYNINVEHMLLNAEQYQAKLTLVERASLSLPPQVEQLLAQGKVIKLTQSDGDYYYRITKHSHQLWKFGPVANNANQSDNDIYFALIFYAVLALLILAFIWPLFRDLAKLQKQAKQFGTDMKGIDANIATTSSIFALSKTMSAMSYRIVESMQMHQDLSRTIAHEIRTPLMRMSFYAESYSEKMEPQDYQQVQADISEIENLVEQYLSFERLDFEKNWQTKSKHSTTELKQFVTQKFTTLKGDIAIHFQSNNKVAFYNQLAIEHALQNLVNNSLRYAKNQISILFAVTEQECSLTISDDGQGVGDNAYQLLQPFHRVDDTKGFGLGLYIVRKIAIWHQGRVEISNDEILGGLKVNICWPNTP